MQAYREIPKDVQGPPHDCTSKPMSRKQKQRQANVPALNKIGIGGNAFFHYQQHVHCLQHSSHVEHTHTRHKPQLYSPSCCFDIRTTVVNKTRRTKVLKTNQDTIGQVYGSLLGKDTYCRSGLYYTALHDAHIHEQVHSCFYAVYHIAVCPLRLAHCWCICKYINLEIASKQIVELSISPKLLDDLSGWPCRFFNLFWIFNSIIRTRYLVQVFFGAGLGYILFTAKKPWWWKIACHERTCPSLAYIIMPSWRTESTYCTAHLVCLDWDCWRGFALCVSERTTHFARTFLL